MTVMQDMIRAEIAIAHVRKLVPEGAPNRHDDIAHSDIMTLFGKFMIGKQQFKSWKSSNPNATRLEKIRANGEIHAALRTGVCGDQADIAFCYLYDQGVRDMGYVNFWDDDNERLNHSFVVLGLGQAFDDARLTQAFVAGEAPEIWGDNAVVCDPWNNDHYHVNGQSWRHGFRQLLRSLSWSLSPAFPMPEAAERVEMEDEALAEADIVCECLLHV